MAEIRAVASANFSPTQCALCNDFTGPFVDTGIELLGYGHVYICMANDRRSGCVRQMARLDNMIDNEIVVEALEQKDQLETRVAALEQELIDSRVVPLQEVLDHLRKQAKPAVKKEATVGD